MAVRLDRANMIKYLLNSGCSPFVKDLTGNNAFHLAARKAKGDMLKVLVSKFRSLEKEIGNPFELKNFG